MIFMRDFRRMGGFLTLALLAAQPASAQMRMQAPPGATPPSAALNDEFDGDALSPDWKVFHTENGWPDKIKAMDVGKTTKGALHLEPYDSAWVRDLQAPYFYKILQGDFDVRARVRAKSANGDIPAGTWSLGGLMARMPNGLTETTWQPNRENWHFITTGVGFEAGKTMTETKGTYNSYSSLKLRPYQSGWVELRLVRVGSAIIALARPDANSPWEVRDRFYRMNASPFMQVGLIAYTTSPDAKPPSGPENAAVANREVLKDLPVDMALEVDWIRFSPAKPAPVRDWYSEVNGTIALTNPNITEAEILAALGD